MRYNGHEVIGLGVSMEKGGNIIALGKGLEATVERIRAQLPVGIELERVSNQPAAVTESVDEFMHTLVEAVVIVLVVSFLALGLHRKPRLRLDIWPGLVVALTIPLVLAITFLFMHIFDISLHKVSLGALIIALGLLVDDAIIAVEMMVRKMEEGMSRFEAATFAYTSTAFPMLTGTLITAAGFLPIGLAKSAAGEYTFTMFSVNAIALLVGSQVGRPGVLTQCSLEEATELKLGMLGHTCYAETISVYGTEPVFTDGDDTPWSKGFLASSYASRGLKMRFTSGSGSEVQMGYAEGKSMLYLEARCIYITKAAGVQGLQNGSVSCIGVPSAVPSGIRAVLAENLICSSLDLECASSNDQTFTHSDMRRTARLLMQFLPGTDFISSGYSAVPNYDNMFAGSNEDAEDFDDYNVIQRDLKVDGGLRPVREEDVIAIRNKAARALQAVFAGMGLPPITDEEVEAATYAHGSKDMPERNIVEDIKFAQEIINQNRNGLEVVKALAQGGFTDVAQDMLNIQKAKLTGDYLHTSAIIVGDGQVLSAVNDINDYAGPATGYRLQGERWEEIKNIPGALDPNEID